MNMKNGSKKLLAYAAMYVTMVSSFFSGESISSSVSNALRDKQQDVATQKAFLASRYNQLKEWKMVPDNFSFEEMQDRYFKLWEKCGKPGIYSVSETNLAHRSHDSNGKIRANYRGNRAFVDNYKELIAEMSHAYSFKNKNGFFNAIKDIFKKGSHDDQYDMVNTEEFNAHSCIEPVFHSHLEGNTISEETCFTEIDRRLSISKELEESGFNAPFAAFRGESSLLTGNDFITHVCHSLEMNDYFQDGKKPFSNVDEPSDKSEIFGVKDNVDIRHSIVLYLASLYGKDEIKREEVFSHVKEMQKTIERCSKFDLQMAGETLKPADVFILSHLDGENGLKKMISELGNGPRVSQIKLVAQKMDEAGHTTLTPESIHDYFQIRRSVEEKNAHKNLKISDQKIDQGAQKNTTSRAQKGETDLKETSAAMTVPDGIQVAEPKSNITLSPAALKAIHKGRC